MKTGRAAIFAVLAAILFVPGLHATDPSPETTARQFLAAFKAQDHPAMKALFAPGAVVSTAVLSRAEPPVTASRTLDEWLDQTKKEMDGVTFSDFEILETSTLTFDQAATVAVRFRSAGKAGPHSFTNEGIDTYSLIQVDGAWRILRYGTFERLDFK